MSGRPGRLTRGDPGEHDAAFTPAGDLLFLSARPAPGGAERRPAAGAVDAARGRRRGRGGRHPARRAGRAGRGPGRGDGRLHVGDPARRRHRRRRRHPAGGAQGRQGDRDPAREHARAVLGPRPRPGPAPAARGVPDHRRAGRRRAADLDRPHPGAGRRARPGGVRRHPGRVDGRRHLAGRRAARRVAPRPRRSGRPDARGTTAAGPFSTTPTTPSTGPSPSPRTAGGSPAGAPAGPRRPSSPRTAAASWCPGRRQRRTGRGPRRRPGLGPLGHRVRLDARLRGPRRDRRRRRARAAVPRRPRQRHRHPADRRRRRVLRPGRRPGRHRVRAALVRRRPARPGPARSRGPGAPVPTPCPRPPRRPRCPAASPRSPPPPTTARALRAWLVLPDGAAADDPRAAAAVDPRRPAEQLERLALAVEPVADGRARLRGAAARPGAVHRVRAGVRHPRAGAAGAPSPTPT